MGYLFLVTCVSMTIGLVMIFKHGLLFENHVHDNDEHHQNDIKINIPAALVGAWFTFTAGMVLVQAKKRKFQLHQKWFIRHVASGMSVAIQRVLNMLSLSLILSSKYLVDNSSLVRQHFCTNGLSRNCNFYDSW